MTSAYIDFNAAKPDSATQSMVQFSGSANANDVALWYGVTQGSMPGFVLSKDNGGGTTEEPQYYYLTNGAQILRAENTWTGGYLTEQEWSISQDTGGTWDAICTQTFSFDGATGALTGTTGGGGMMNVVWYAIGRVKAAFAALTDHLADTGSAVHGLGTMSTQDDDDVAIVGGYARLAYERENIIAKNDVSGSVSLDWSAGGLVTANIINSAAAFTHTNLPNGVVGFLTLDLTFTAVPTLLLSGVKWGSASPPAFTNGGRDIVVLMCHDGSTISGSFTKDLR